jgi:hypothetical protein
MTIYQQEFRPTWLMVKCHVTTGLLYLCKTINKDPEIYLGSGKYWLRHIHKHGTRHVFTLWRQYFTDEAELKRVALELSEIDDVANRDDWANLAIETGLDGTPPSDKTRIRMSEANRGKPKTPEQRAKIAESVRRYRQQHPKTLTPEHKAKISESVGNYHRSLRF